MVRNTKGALMGPYAVFQSLPGNSKMVSKFKSNGRYNKSFQFQSLPGNSKMVSIIGIDEQEIKCYPAFQSLPGNSKMVRDINSTLIMIITIVSIPSREF